MTKHCSNPVVIKGEVGKSSAQTGPPWLRNTPPKKQFQQKNSASKFEIKAEPKKMSESQVNPVGTTNGIQAAFDFLQAANKDQHGFTSRFQAKGHHVSIALNTGLQSLIQAKDHVKHKADSSPKSTNRHANGHVIPMCAQVFTRAIVNWKANLPSMQHSFKNHHFLAKTSVKAPKSPVSLTKPACLLQPNEACTCKDPTSSCLNLQMNKLDAISASMTLQHMKDNQGNMNTRSFQMCDQASSSLLVTATMSAAATQKPFRKDLKTLPRFMLIPKAPWFLSKHQCNPEPVIPVLESKPETSTPTGNPKTPMPAPDKSHTIQDAHVNLLDPRKSATDSGEGFHGTLIKFQDRDLPTGNQELGHSFADTKDMQAKILSHVLSPNPASIVPKCQRNIIPKSLFKKSKIWKPGEPAHHFKDDALSLEKLSQKQGIAAGLSAKTCIKFASRKLERWLRIFSAFAPAPKMPLLPSKCQHDVESATPSSTTSAMSPIPVDVSIIPTATPHEHSMSKDAQSDLFDPGEAFFGTSKTSPSTMSDFQDHPDASKMKLMTPVSIDCSKTPMDTPIMHGIPKELQLDLLDPGEHLLDSGEKFSDTLIDLQDEGLGINHHPEFDSIAFVNKACNSIFDHALHPTLASSMIWKLEDQEPPNIIPVLQKDIIPKLLPKESKVWKPGEPFHHSFPNVQFEQSTVTSV